MKFFEGKILEILPENSTPAVPGLVWTAVTGESSTMELEYMA
jgi:hypothetical protein